MSEKTLKLLAGAVAALLLVYAATAIVSRAPGSAAADGGALASALEEAGEEGIETIRIRSAADTVELRRTERGWTANGHPADTARVAELLRALREAKVAHLASSNPANHARLGVSDGEARVLEVARGEGEPLRFLVGDAGPSYSGAYIRLPGRDEAYLVGGPVRTHVLRTADDWRDRVILTIDTAAVRTVDVTREGERYTLRRGDGGWTAGDAPADSGAVADILRELARLEAAGFADDTAAAGEPFGALVALGASGDTLASVSLATGGGPDLRVTVPGDPTVFELARWRADRLLPKRADVETKEAAGT